MEEALELLDFAADAGLGGVLTWILRLLGLLSIVAGVAVFLLVEITVLVPAALVVVGLVLLVAPSIVLFAAELA